MNRSRLPFVAVITIGFVIAASAFRIGSASISTSASFATGSLSPASPMLQPRSGHSATLLANGKVLIVGGMRRNQDFYRSAELYDPATGTFQATGEMSTRRVGHVAVLLRSGKVLIAGGWIGSHDTTDAAELYDPATGKFTVIAKMTTRRARPSATLLANGNVLIAGGDDHDARDAALASAEIFDASTLHFRPTGTLHAARSGQTATLLRDGRVLMAGGGNSVLLAGAELYDPKTETFTETGSLITPRYKHTAGLLADGRVLIAGGSDQRDWSGNLSTAEIYNPKTGKFLATASLNDSRFKLPDEAVQLPSGRLLVAGGSKQAEVFDPVRGSFFPVAGQMNDRWHYMSETRLGDGSVLLAGGYPNSDQTTSQTWIYRP
jgi:Galactose oxidase, central domain/Kelch motif